MNQSLFFDLKWEMRRQLHAQLLVLFYLPPDRLWELLEDKLRAEIQVNLNDNQ